MTTPASGTVASYTYTYNSLSQRTRVTREDGSYWSYGYNDRGELVFGKKYWSDNPPVMGQQTEYAFDNIGNRRYAKAGGNEAGALRQSTYTTSSISPSQRSGWELFKGKAHCIDCHTFSASSPFLTDFKFHNTGVALKGRRFQEFSSSASDIRDTKPSDVMALSALAHSDRFSDLGRFLVTREPKDLGAVKTPTLRDIELTTPYMHDGSEKTLIDVVKLYNKGGESNPNLDRLMKPLHLTDPEISDLVEFMRALTSDEVLRKAQNSTPQNRSPVPLLLR